MAAPDYTKLNMQTLNSNRESFSLDNQNKQSKFAYDESNILLLQTAQRYWSALDDFRTRRRRAVDYYRGDQWGDIIFNPETQTYMTEETYIKLQGKVPLKQNQIRTLVKNLIGQYRMDTTKPAVISRKRIDATTSEMLTNTLQYGLNINEAKEKDTRAIEEFFLSGSVVQKTGYEFIPKLQSEEVKLKNSPITHMFFTSNVKDVEDDIKFIGQFHDMYVKDIIAAFAESSESQAKAIKDIYAYVLDPDIVGGTSAPALSSYFVDNLDFYISTETDKGRVFEMWYEKSEMRLRCHDMQKGEMFVTPLENKKYIDDENRMRRNMAKEQFAIAKPELNEKELTEYTNKMVPLIEYKKSYEKFWYCKFLSPFGHVLWETETPYEHKSHPYSVLLYPLVDGMAWGFVEDIIDQQRYINRLVTLLDSIIGSSAKGVLLVPEEAIGKDMNINDYAEGWSKFNGVLKVRTKGGVAMPKQISVNSTNVGINELLNLQNKYLAEVSGVSGSSQGQDGKNKPASLYAQESQNSSLNSKDYFESYNNYKNRRNWKVLKTQIQYYPKERQLALSGSNLNDEALLYQRDKVKDVQFEMTMGRSPDSPIYRGVIEENLKEFLGAQLITFETYLRNTSLPFADNLLNEVQRDKEQAQQGGGMGTGAMEEVGNQLRDQGANASQADPRAMQLLQQYEQGR